ncbi:MAG TPA: YceI family protein [Gallionella sp.]|nr:YceI family protein [Gallionella sp.]
MKTPYRYFLPLTVLLLANAAIHARAAEFNQVQAGNSTLTFAYRQMGVPMEGKFHKFAARIAFDPARTSAARAQIEVDLAGIDTGSSEADAEVLGKQWFNTKAYPSAQFVATGVKTLGGNRYEALGKFTLKGKSQDVSAPFTFRQEGSAAVFDGAFTLKRLDYAIGEGAWADLSAVANEVQVRFHIVANAAAKK